ncbi:MAG: permease [Myxococcota bacterium]|jgi:hypothetical protein|nr:permease [Myxococcota bacterium]
MLTAMWDIILQLAPWLLVGAAIAGILHIALPQNFIQKQMQGKSGVFKAIITGVPLPLCSCAVIPTGLGLKKDGASNGACIGFMISTPQTGVDSILVSASFLGLPFALFKVLSAAITGLIGGLICEIVEPQKTQEESLSVSSTPPKNKLKAFMSHSLELLEMIWGWIVFGIVLSALLNVYLPENMFAQLGASHALLAPLIALAVSVPLYVCATASVPIAAALVAGGMPFSAALVFLMAGPATNMATIGAVYRGFGKKTLGIYLSTIILGSLACGLLFDFVLSAQATNMTHSHTHSTWWAQASAWILLGLFACFALGDIKRLLRKQKSFEEDPENVHHFIVEGMTCQGCVTKLEKALYEIPDIEAVSISLESKEAKVQGQSQSHILKKAIEEAGFQVGNS